MSNQTITTSFKVFHSGNLHSKLPNVIIWLTATLHNKLLKWGEAMHSQMLKGVLEGCILYIISQEEVYGYELSTKLNQYGFTFVSEGSIYPLLLRMQKEKLIAGTLKASSLGPKRKYYHVTDKGFEQLEEFKRSWGMVSTTVNNLLQGE